jgi:hypothetical protein
MIADKTLDEFLTPQDLAEGATNSLPGTQPLPLDEALSDPAAPADEPIQVAGPIDAAARWISQRAAKATRSLPKMAQGEAKNLGRVIVANEADPAVAAKAIVDQTARTTQAAAKRAQPAITGGTGGQPAITGAPPVEPLNLDKQGVWTSLNQVQDVDSLRAWVQQVNEVEGITQPKTMTHAEVKAKAAQHGLDQVIERALAGDMNRDVSEVYALLDGMTAGARKLDELATRVKADPLNSALAVEFQQALALQGVLQKTVKGVQVDIARSLGVFKIPREGKDTASIQAMIDQSGGLNDIAQLAERYLMLPTQAAKNKLTERTLTTNVKDLWFTTWINGLLSSPVTHARNVGGNAAFAAYQIPERVLAGLIGNTRHIFGADDFASLGDAWAYASAIPSGILDGAALAAKAYGENMPSDPIGKIELAINQQGKLGEQFGASGAWGHALDYYGTFITLPGRALMAEDEFFKAVAYRSELTALVNRGKRTEYDRLVQNGIPDAQAKAQADAWGISALDNPTEEIDKAALQAARVATFTAPLEGGLGELQKVLQHPILKLYFPFVRTPANIMLETLKRTPAAFVSPSFWGAMKEGGAAMDSALAKASLGSSLVLGVGALSVGHRVTGSGPADRAKQEHLKNQGWQPFSIVYDRADVSQDELDTFNELTGGMVRVGPDKVYVSYAGIEPIASFLAMGASASETAMESDDMAESEKWIFAATMAGMDYLGKQPMLAGLSRLVSDLGQGSKADKSFFVSLLNNVSKTATGFAIGGSPAGAYSAVARAFERSIDPTISETMPADMDQPAPVKGFWQALNQYKAGMPGAAKGLPPKLNVWGEPMQRGFGDARDFVDPFFVSNGKLSEADAILIAIGQPIKRPNTKQQFTVEFNGMAGKGTVDLSAEQYNKLLTYTNEVPFGSGNVKDAIVMLYKNPSFSRLTAEQQQTTIAGLYGDAMAVAKARLLEEDSELLDRARENAEWHSGHPDTPRSFFLGH